MASKTNSKTSKTEMTFEQTKAKLAEIMGRDVTDAEVNGVLAAQETQRVKEAEVIAKHGKGSGRINRQTGEVEELKIVAGSYSFKENDSGKGGKWGVEIECHDCGEIRWVATSDLHQVARCEAHQKEHKAALRKGKRGSGKSSLAKNAALLAKLKA